MNDFGRRLKMLREQRDLPLSKLAEDLNTTKSALSRYENGKMEPGLKVMTKVSEYFNVSLDWLAGYGDDDKFVVERFVGDAKQPERLASYANAIKKSINKDISPEKLEQVIEMIDILKK